MQTPPSTPIRRRSGYSIVPAGPEVAVSPGPAFLKSICSTLGGWMQDQPGQPADELNTSNDSNVDEKAHSIVQVLEGMGTWALQAAALNICLPSSGWLKAEHISRASSRCSSLSPDVRHPMHPPSTTSSGSSSERDLAVGTAGRDTRKTAGQPDYCKTPQSTSTTAQQETATAAAESDIAAAAAVGCATRIAELTAENEGMRRELICLRTSVGTLYITCSTLKEENQRLRVAVDAANEDLLSDALEQLLGEKNALQQEVAKLKQQNKSLQELLEYTAPAAAPSASEGLSWAHAIYDGGSNSNLAGMSAAAADAAHAGVSSRVSWQDHEQQVLSMSVHGGSIVQPGAMQQQQQVDPGQDNYCGYWLATPAGSVAGSSTGEISTGRESPEVSSNRSSSRRPTCDNTHIQQNTAGSTTAVAAGLMTVDEVASSENQQQPSSCNSGRENVGIDEALVDPIDCDMAPDWPQQQQQQQQCVFESDQKQQSPRMLAQPGRTVGKRQQLLIGINISKVVGAAGIVAGAGMQSPKGCVVQQGMLGGGNQTIKM